MVDEARIQAIINSFQEMSGQDSLQKEAGGDVNPEEVLQELEKIAQEEPTFVQPPKEEGDKEKAREKLLRGLTSDDPSPEFQELREALEAGDEDRALDLIRSLV